MRPFQHLAVGVAVLLGVGAAPWIATAHHDRRGGHPQHHAAALVRSRTVAVCAGQFIPDGWAIADTQTNFVTCGSTPTNNVWLLADLRGLPSGQTVTLCQGPVPDGWAVTGFLTDATRCGGALTGPFNNVMVLRKL